MRYSNGQEISNGHISDEEVRFDLTAEERLYQVSCQCGAMVDGLTFLTTQGRTLGPYGGAGGQKQETTAPERMGYLSHVMGSVSMANGKEMVSGLRFVWGYYTYSD